MVRANTYRVNVIWILILMIPFSHTKRLNEAKTDGLNTEEVFGLCLLGEKNFGLLLMRVPKLPRKSLIFLLLFVFVFLFTNEKVIITLSETHISSVNSELFQIPGFKFVHKN